MIPDILFSSVLIGCCGLLSNDTCYLCCSLALIVTGSYWCLLSSLVVACYHCWLRSSTVYVADYHRLSLLVVIYVLRLSFAIVADFIAGFYRWLLLSLIIGFCAIDPFKLAALKQPVEYSSGSGSRRHCCLREPWYAEMLTAWASSDYAQGE